MNVKKVLDTGPLLLFRCVFEGVSKNQGVFRKDTSSPPQKFVAGVHKLHS